MKIQSSVPDPLVNQSNTGASLGGVDPASVEPELDVALRTAEMVPERVQQGPTCGLYALGMVMDYYESQNPRNEDPLVQASDVHRSDSHTLPPNTPNMLLPTAKQDGYTTQGEMFYANQLALLAKQFGYQAQVQSPLTLDGLQACLGRGHPALVPFDVDMDGDPGLYGGARAHWCVVEGLFQKDGVPYVIATHGWEGKTYVWRAQDLIQSSDQLKTPDFPTAPSDISTTLADRFVEVSPEQAAGA
jgi:hypothetical protein